MYRRSIFLRHILLFADRTRKFIIRWNNALIIRYSVIATMHILATDGTSRPWSFRVFNLLTPHTPFVYLQKVATYNWHSTGDYGHLDRSNQMSWFGRLVSITTGLENCCQNFRTYQDRNISVGRSPDSTYFSSIEFHT